MIFERAFTFMHLASPPPNISIMDRFLVTQSSRASSLASSTALSTAPSTAPSTSQALIADTVDLGETLDEEDLEPEAQTKDGEPLIIRSREAPDDVDFATFPVKWEQLRYEKKRLVNPQYRIRNKKGSHRRSKV